MSIINYQEVEMRHKKKSKKKKPKKSDHKHVFIERGPSAKYSFAIDFTCEICGKTKEEINFGNLIVRN